MIFFKKNEVKDEWITHTKNKIYAEIYIIVLTLCGISAIVKYLMYDFQLKHIVTELVILIVSSIYPVYRSVKLGVFSAEVELHDRTNKWTVQKKNWFLGVGFGVAIALAMGINSAVQYADGFSQRIYYFFLVGFVSLLIYLPFFVAVFVAVNEIAKRKSERAMNELLSQEDIGDDDEKKY